MKFIQQTGEANARQGEMYRTKNSQIQIIRGEQYLFKLNNNLFSNNQVMVVSYRAQEDRGHGQVSS